MCAPFFATERFIHGVRKARPTPAYWIIDETGFPKTGKHPVGVARQYCGALGKQANYQVAFSTAPCGRSSGRKSALSWRLYLSEIWTRDVDRRAAAAIPGGVTYQSKTGLALAALDEAPEAWGAYPVVVLADGAYGGSFRVARGAASTRGLVYAVRVTWTTTG